MEMLATFAGLPPRKAIAASSLYERDPSSRLPILRAMSQGSPIPSEGIVPCPGPGGVSEVLFMVCMRFPGSSEEAEPIIAASFMAKCVRSRAPLPMITEDSGVEFCAKTLVSLSVFLEAMNRRTARAGAPKPEYYRKVAQGILSKKTVAHRALSSHHQAWESFIHENFCPST
jgi:hypothetical protein